MGRYESDPRKLHPVRGCFLFAGKGRIGATTPASEWQNLHFSADRKAKGATERQSHPDRDCVTCCWAGRYSCRRQAALHRRRYFEECNALWPGCFLARRCGENEAEGSVHDLRAGSRFSREKRGRALRRGRNTRRGRKRESDLFLVNLVRTAPGASFSVGHLSKILLFFAP